MFPKAAEVEDVNKVIFYPTVIVILQSKLLPPIPNWYTHTQKEYTGIIYIWTTEWQATEGKKAVSTAIYCCLQNQFHRQEL